MWKFRSTETRIEEKQMKFRSDINGLRALAVLPVLFFHAGVPGFAGGFLGVDVFFLISGFLISTIIVSKLQNGSFRFLEFYDNRIRRILPALLVVTTITTAFSVAYMVPNSIRNYGESLVATMLSANNILLYKTSGYWSLGTDFKPLFHTWSLAVEEQYYLLTPLLLFVIFVKLRCARTIALTILCLMLLLSLVFSFACSDHEFNFLMIFSRAWELLAGAILALLLEKRSDDGNIVLSAIGLVLIIFSYVYPYFLSANPAIVESVPILGAALIIMYSRPDNATGKVLSIKPLGFIGLISYSIYLWHQPILAFVRLISRRQPHYWTLASAALLSVPLACLSWAFVENVFRNKKAIPGRILYTAVISGIGLNVALGLAMYRTYGFQALWPQLSYGSDPRMYVDAPNKFQGTSFRDNGKFRVLVIGNSFARDYINMIQETGYLNRIDLVYLPGRCEEYMSQHGSLDDLLAESAIVIYAGNWGEPDSHTDELPGIVSCYKYLASTTRGKVYVLGAKNFGWNNDFVRTMGNGYLRTRVKPADSIVEFNGRAKEALGDAYVDLIAAIEDKSGSVPIFAPGGHFITYDTNHLTRPGASYIGRLLFERYPDLVPGAVN